MYNQVYAPGSIKQKGEHTSMKHILNCSCSLFVEQQNSSYPTKYQIVNTIWKNVEEESWEKEKPL